MKRTFKLIIFSFCSIFFIAKCLAFPAVESHYAYVSSANSHDITSYQINENGDFINPITEEFPVEGLINGLVTSPDNKNIYFSYTNKIGKCELDNNGRISNHCSIYSLPSSSIANFLAVDRIHHRMYITDKAKVNVYVCDINTDSNDSLENCDYVLQFKKRTYGRAQGIDVSVNGKFVYIAYQKFDSWYTIQTCPIGESEVLDPTKCMDFLSLTINEYIGGIKVDLRRSYELYAADRQQGKAFITCELDHSTLRPFRSYNFQDSRHNVHYRTYDVALDSTHRYLYITTSQGYVKKSYRQDDEVRIVDMPATHGRSAYAIAVSQ